MKRVIAIILVIVLVLGMVGMGAIYFLQPKEFLGEEDSYIKITLQISDDLFYDVRIPSNAVLLETDGATIYKYDIITVGIQDTEPSTPYKVSVGERWVYADSEEGWYRAVLKGFDMETAYEGNYDTSNTKWEDTIPHVAMTLDDGKLELLRGGHAFTLGGDEFIVSQVAYGTFQMAVDRSLVKMSTLYKQPLYLGYNDGKRMWMTSNRHTVAVASINYNTCLVISAYGETGRQYAAALMGDYV